MIEYFLPPFKKKLKPNCVHKLIITLTNMTANTNNLATQATDEDEKNDKWEIHCERAGGMRGEIFEFDSESEARAEYNKMVEDEDKEPRWETIYLNYDDDCVEWWSCP
jgi:hypothetical protein